MCRPSSKNPGDEKQPLIEKIHCQDRQYQSISSHYYNKIMSSFSAISSPGASTSVTTPDQDAPVQIPMWQRILNKACCLVAAIGMIWYTILVAQGEYTEWALPLFISAAICKLFTTTPQFKQRHAEGADNDNIHHHQFHEKRQQLKRRWQHHQQKQRDNLERCRPN